VLGYKLDHRTFRFEVERGAGAADGRFLIERIATRSLHARVATPAAGAPEVVALAQTPHCRWLAGDEAQYAIYLESVGEAEATRSKRAFAEFLGTSEGYLSADHASHYILCELVDGKRVILDGLHRAAVLLHNGVEFVPVAVRMEKAAPRAQLERYLLDYKDDFLEWYTPIDLGGLIIHERTFPHFKERPSFLHNRERGQAKFDYIIRDNLPELEGKTVCDVGCSVGLLSYNLIRMGARSVDGFDRSETMVQPTNRRLPRQSVVQQAYFVKNLFQLHTGRRYETLNFYERDIATIDFATFEYDVFFSCCVLYHFGELFEKIIRDISPRVREVFLQANLGHDGALARYASVQHHRELLERYGYRVRVDAPPGYHYPVIVGTK
jgi:SAM-dependent methyltransferase